ncbi:MAG: alpha/beta fold hydrolase [Candidatus Paceibacterota bacterium]
MEKGKIQLTTTDGISLNGDYYPGFGTRGLVLLHMMPETKESWKEFAGLMQEEGWDIVALDLRGHGNSDGGPDGYKTFENEEHQKSILDVEAGVTFLETRGIARSSVALCGASIGANLTIQSMAEHTDTPAGIALSPGFNYKGVETRPCMPQLGQQRLLLVASRDDERSYGNCATMAEVLAEEASESTTVELVVYEHAGHGTDMFGIEKPDLAQRMKEFINDAISR